ncbi:hypothetical protein P280DRAFT_390734 [Massarina eburnea CBS 473.64]|uniref:Uncharacterized protein n=1 Tax=Massarina eburnea CBS 473.64 TaxID=1395130 RepID=A0A6A6SE12_9PLEO|nr:hypothetical protein P280DRAFT_390734 [Massarina eburnea CBS 473.64]
MALPTFTGVSLAPPSSTGVSLRPITTTDPDPRNASISIRNYIYFLPYPMPDGVPVPYTLGLPETNPLNLPPQAFEPTSTLVLTSLNKTFVDVRVFRPFRPSDPTLPIRGGPRKRLEWAFSGTSYSHVMTDPFAARAGAHGPNGGERVWAGPVKAARWTHWVDSRIDVMTPAIQIPPDTGVMFPINDVQTLEHGAAPSVNTRKMQSYEEMWTDLEIEACWPKTTKVNIVMRIEAPELRGVAIRLGRYAQAIMMQGVYPTVERWEYTKIVRTDADRDSIMDEGDDQMWMWERTVRIGDEMLPCPLMWTKEDSLVMGGLVKFGKYEWTVEEKFEWEDVE